ncbi:unnamed protein product, partial [Ectocarpus sp. 12 AP-2014]
MAEVFSSNSPCMLGKRVLSPHSHGTLMGGQLDFSSKKRRLGQGLDQAGSFDRSESYQQQQQRSPSPVRAGKRARPFSPLQPSAHFPSGGAAAGEAASSSHGGSGFFGGGSFSQHQQQHQQKAHRTGAEDGELAALRREVAALRAHAAEKESGLNMAREENGRLKEGMGMFQKELERLSAENRILKRAVGIQNTKGKEV